MIRFRWRMLAWQAGFLGMTLAGGTAQAQDASERCARLNPGRDRVFDARLTALPDAPTVIESAVVEAAANGLPEICHVLGFVAPSIGFELRLPTSEWNGKFMMQGCGGYCGSLHTDRADVGLARRYAVASTDMGHKIKSWLFAYNNVQGEIDFAYRATHVVAIATKVLVDAYYAKAPAHAYFMGCSTGGRQGMVEAQRFPKDFDGIVAGSPPLNETADGTLSLLWSARANIDADGRTILDAAKLPAIHAAVLQSCRAKDGVLENPAACTWDPSAISCGKARSGPACLSDAEANVVRRIYSGATDATGKPLFHGMVRGSELDWTPDFIGANGDVGSDLRGGGPIASFVDNMAFFYDEKPGYDVLKFDFDRDPDRMALTEAIYNAENPDLRRYRAAGGKLILYHGWNDNQVPATGSVDYYETATRTMGGAQPTADFFRLFMLPGSGHCFGGVGGGEVDWITHLENWVERGTPPDDVTVFHMTSNAYLPRPRHPLEVSDYDRTRRIHPYPRLPQ